MALPNIFAQETSESVIARINLLAPDSQPLWGKMNVTQMLAHCNVTYEMVYDNKHAKPNLLMGFLLKILVKKKVTNEVPYERSIRTAPAFLISDTRDFEMEKVRLVNFIRKTQELGERHFEGKESLSFGKLTKDEWNNMFYKHLDHHLRQFGV